LADDAPLYDRPLAAPADRAARAADDPTATASPGDAGEDLLALLGDPSWVYRQYDHQLFLNTVVGPGGDAALLRLAGPGLPASQRGIAVTTDANPRWCALDPREGTALTLAEGVANLACVGARAVAVVNCLNFGNPEHPEVMWQLSEVVDGLSGACRELDLPVIGGNVSLYNESGGTDIDPTPVIGVLGLVETLRRRPPGAGWVEGSSVVLLGARGAGSGPPHPLGGTRWAVECRERRGGVLAPLDPAAHRRLVALVVDLVGEAVAGGEGLLDGVHDVSGGGLGVALAEMALSSGGGASADGASGIGASGIGVRVGGVAGHAELFTELPSRMLVATGRPDEVLSRARQAGVPAEVLGVAAGDRLVVEDLLDVAIEAIAGSWVGALPSALGEPVSEGST
ncbi:MAG TPA: AIR synthase related protein, partial [Acidimicrobiales bacterium]|nr:AIR synthase related protein [Acidimicrobiales bacterium]